MFHYLLSDCQPAQTPDGETPANEGVCDPLKADGITKGLYGLCVAFCEAQDHADASNAITTADVEALLAAAPSGKILENYNKRKQATDPAMPCIVVEEPCPCWTTAELNDIDGVSPAGIVFPVHECSLIIGGIYHAEANDPYFTDQTQAVLVSRGTSGRLCAYINEQVDPPILRQVEDLSEETRAACDAAIVASCIGVPGGDQL